MKTGIDISIATCRTEGYPVVEHISQTLNPEHPYLLSISNPIKWFGSRVRKNVDAPSYLYYDRISYSELWRQFASGGSAIQEYCDFKNHPYPSPQESPTFQDFVMLANTVYYFQGIE